MLNIIHLKERPDRRASLEREMAAQNISAYTLWPGFKSEFNWKGIRRAHQNIISFAKTNDIPYITVGEDDIKFLGRGAYEYYLSQIPNPETFDIFLGGIMNGDINEDHTVKDGYFTGLTLYTMSYKFYDTFLSIRQVGDIDALLRGRGKFVVCDPMVVTQHGGYSDNKEKLVKSYDERLIGRNLWKG